MNEEIHTIVLMAMNKKTKQNKTSKGKKKTPCLAKVENKNSGFQNYLGKNAYLESSKL